VDFSEVSSVTAEWVAKAEADYDVSCVLRRSRKPSRYDAICFHCQQSAEKYLKARQTDLEISFPRTHDLGALFHLLRRAEPMWMTMLPAMQSLTDFAVTTRYPGGQTDSAAASEAFAAWVRLRRLARVSLGLSAR